MQMAAGYSVSRQSRSTALRSCSCSACSSSESVPPFFLFTTHGSTDVTSAAASWAGVRHTWALPPEYNHPFQAYACRLSPLIHSMQVRDTSLRRQFHIRVNTAHKGRESMLS